MSDKHDHSHHHHDHDHDHDHGHEHHHHHDAPAQPAPVASEDAGSQALAEALKSSFAIVKVVMYILLIVFLCSGFFTVGPQEKAIVLRFGRPVGGEGAKALLSAGLHWGFPPPIDEVVRIPISEIQQVTSTAGWYFTTKEMEVNNMELPAGPSLNPAQDGYTITADGNIIHTRATLYYRIEEPIKYAFSFVNASNTVQSALDNALIYASLRYKVDDALTRDISGFKEAVQSRVSELVARQDLGIVVEQCQVESRPPRQLKQAFDQVLTALSIRDKVRNDALSYQNQVLSRATAEASSRTNAAEAERVRLVESVKAEAQRFNDLLPKYQSNPTLFANILLSERIGQVLTNMQEKYYVPERGDGKPTELRLQLSREPQKPVSQQAAPNQTTFAP